MNPHLVALLIAFVKGSIMLGGVMGAAAYFVLLERKVCAWMQDRHGPNRVGAPLSLLGLKDLRLFGLGQPLADGLKMIFKEEYTPKHVDRTLYTLAPLIIMAAALATFAVIPFGSVIPAIPQIGLDKPTTLVIAPGIDVGMLYVFALSSIAVYGVILGGWASNNKYSFLGGLRSSAQLIAYELPLSLGILGVVLACGSLKLEVIQNHQASTAWFAFLQPLGFFVFVTAAFAEAARLPFDLPEAEQELIGGYHTEYAGMKLVLFLTAEFIHMITASFLIVILFFGGWHLPFGLTGPVGLGIPDGGTIPAIDNIGWGMAIWRIVVLFTKIVLVILFFMLVRWTWPRFRFDQLMTLAWKVMLPMGIANLIAVAVAYEASRGGFGPDIEKFVSDNVVIWLSAALGWLVFIGAWLVVAYVGPLVTDNRPRLDLLDQGIDAQI